jgi:hypothetical protein
MHVLANGFEGLKRAEIIRNCLILGGFVRVRCQQWARTVHTRLNACAARIDPRFGFTVASETA